MPAQPPPFLSRPESDFTMKLHTLTVILAALAAPACLAAAPSKADLAKGEKVYTSTCQACHGTGVLGAPKAGDKAAWQPRAAKGVNALYESALNGVRTMPARGGNPALKSDEVKAAVDYMLSK
jgi:cytochrome c5